jgi:hypothetical protein
MSVSIVQKFSKKTLRVGQGPAAALPEETATRQAGLAVPMARATLRTCSYVT